MTLIGYGTQTTSSLFRLLETTVTLTSNEEAALSELIALTQNVSSSLITIIATTQTTIGLRVESITTILLIGYFANFDVTSITTFIATNQNNTINNPTIFNTIILQVQETYNDSSIKSVSSATVTQPVVTITEPIHSDNKKTKNISKGNIAAAVIMSIFGAILIMGGLAYYFRYGYAIKNDVLTNISPIKPITEVIKLDDIQTATL